MNGRIAALLFLIFAACEIADQTTEVEQALTSGDCVPGGNYQGAKLPSLPLWNGYTPPTNDGQILLDVPDWRKDTKTSGKGFHVAVLTEPGTGKILWGATVPAEKLPSFRLPNRFVVGSCCRPPPCECRGCCGEELESTWMARNFLEASLRYVDVADNAATAAGPLK